MATIYVFGSFSLHGATGAAAGLIGFTGLAGGTGRYAVLLSGGSEHGIERATAVGFFLGLLSGCFTLALESAT
ncbi:MAG TPA: hypothetical protein VG816_09840 [Solirubrobacterales bacterium]|nr:hypothetical protein [Solirubrobacterales bacterium]